MTQKDLEMIYQTYQTILNMSGDGFLVVDREGTIVDINQAYVQKLEGANGLTREEIIGRDVMEYIPVSNLPRFIHAAKPLMERDAKQAVAEKFFHNMGSSHLISTRATIYSPQKGVLGAVAQVKFYDDVVRLVKRIRQMEQELDYYKYELSNVSSEKVSPHKDSMMSIIGVSDAIIRAKSETDKAAAVDFNVLILGETGVGKELFATAIHNASRRRGGPFVKLNCSAIPAELFESELFGYTEGSFTGASKRGKKGKFEQANGGTIFLDEIGDMPLTMQVKLLRVLQEREIDVIGGAKPKPIDVRIIAATNKNLEECIRNNTFRSDLFFRLNVINIRVPALRDRKEDISLLVESILSRLNAQYKTNTTISSDVLDVLEEYNWPGNVRELINFVERMYAYAEEGIIEVRHIPALIQNLHNKRKCQGTLSEQLAEEEKLILINALEINKHNCKKTADYLGIHRSTLYKKLERYGMNRSGNDPVPAGD